MRQSMQQERFAGFLVVDVAAHTNVIYRLWEPRLDPILESGVAMTRLRVSCAVLFAALLAVEAFAGESRIHLEHAYFHGFTYRPGSWHRVHARVVNPEPRDIVATLTLSVPVGSTRTSRYVYTDIFPAGSTRNVWFDVVPGSESEYTIELIGGQGQRATKYKTLAHPLGTGSSSAKAAEKPAAEAAKAPEKTNEKAKAKQTGKEKGDAKGTAKSKEKAKAQSAAAPSPEPEAGAVGASKYMVVRFDDADCLPTTRMSLVYNETSRDMGGIYFPAEEMPEKWVAFDGFDCIMVGKFPSEVVRPMQWDALAQWVASGGMLLVFPGGNWDEVRDSPLADLLPVRLIGQRPSSELVLEGGAERLRLPGRDYKQVWELENLDGDVLYHDGPYPMVVRKRYGSGTIYVCAFPGGLLNDWSGSRRFWAEILRPDERIVLTRDTGFATMSGDLLSRLAGAKVLPPSFVVVTLGIYVAITLASLIVFRLRGRMELAWAIILPAGIAIGVICLQTGSAYRKKVGDSVTALQLTQVRAGQTQGTSGGTFGVHVLETASTDVVARDPDVFLASALTSETVGGDLSVDTIVIGPLYRIANQTIKSGAMPTFRFDSLAGLKAPVACALAFGEGGCRLTITNQSGSDLESCLLISNQYAMRVGPVANGQTRTVALGPDDVQNQNNYTSKGVERSLDQVRTSVVSSIFGPGANAMISPWRDRIFVAGWQSGSDVPVVLSLEKTRKLERRPASLLVQVLTPDPPPAGTRLRIMRPFFCLSSSAVRFMQFGAAGQGVRMSGPSALDFTAAPHPALRHVRMRALDLRLTLSAWAYSVDLQVRNQKTGRYTTVLSMRRPEGVQTARVENAAEYYDPEKGTIAVRLNVERLAEEKTPARPSAAVPLSEWSIADFSLEAEAESF